VSSTNAWSCWSAALAGRAAIDALHEDIRLLQGQLRELASRR